MMKRSTAWLLASLLLGPSAALAVSTRSFVIDTSDAFEKGTLKGSAAFNSGKLTRAPKTERIGIEGVPVAYASSVGPDGSIYVATGNEGVIQRVTPQGSKPFADTPAALVTSLVWAGTTLYAGTLPGARVYAIAPDGKQRELGKLEGADHVWALAYAPKQRTLYAATGPEGKLFAIDVQGRAQLVHDDEAEHLLSLALDERERLYVGTSNGARLLRVAERKVELLYDFPGQELTALDVGAGLVAVAANEFPAPPPAAGDTKDLGAAARAKRLKPGKGSVFTLDGEGHVLELGRFDESHVSALELEKTGEAVHAGLAQEGRIVRLSRSGERAVWADVDERQIAAMHLQSESPHFVSSDGVAVYIVGSTAAEGEWTSAVLDAKAPARFGELTFRARGSVRFATRSGNSENPSDGSWSAWSEESARHAPIRSPAGRFLQLRAKLAGDAELYAVEAFYLPQNLPPRVRSVRAKPKTEPGKGTAIALTWEMDNPDDDKLRYRLFVRRDEQASWLPLQREYEFLEQTDYTWDTRSVPEGHYRARVVATDEASNPDPYVARAEAVSAPILVDNRAPELRDLRYEKGLLSGRAIDSLGPVSNLELSIDSGLYRPIFPVDDLLDTRDEPFRVEIGALSPGTHVVSVRATDAAQNSATSAVEVHISGH